MYHADAAVYVHRYSSLYHTIYIRVPKEHRPVPSATLPQLYPSSRTGRRLLVTDLTIIPLQTQESRRRMFVNAASMDEFYVLLDKTHEELMLRDNIVENQVY